MPKISTFVNAVMQSMSSARQSEVKAWEEEITPCEHTLTIEQLVSSHIPASGKPLHLLSTMDVLTLTCLKGLHTATHVISKRTCGFA